MRRGDARGQERRGDGELDDDEGAQQTARVAVEGCAARGNADRFAQIGARSARSRQQTKTQANQCHHAGGEGEDWQIEARGVIKLAHRAAGRICAFRTKREKYRRRPRRNEQTECGSDRSQEKRLDELLPNELSSARAQGSTQRKLPFAFDHAREEQAGEIRRRDQECAERRTDDDKNLRPQIHDEALVQRRHVGGARVRRIWIVAIDRGAQASHRFLGLGRCYPGVQTTDAIQIVIVDRRGIVRLENERQPDVRAIWMPKRFRHHANDRSRRAIDHDRTSKNITSPV